MNNSEKERLQAKIDELQKELDDLDKKDWEPWRAERYGDAPENKYLIISPRGVARVRADVRTQENYADWKSGNYYHPKHKEALKQLAKMDRFAVLVRQYGLEHGGTILTAAIGHLWGIHRYNGGDLCLRRDMFCTVGDIGFRTQEEAQACLEWVQRRMGDE